MCYQPPSRSQQCFPELRDQQWERIKDKLPGKVGDRGRSGADNRSFVNGVLWVLRSGARWLDLPIRYGKYKSVHKRFRRWAKNQVWEHVFHQLVGDQKNDYLMIDSTIVKAHQQAASYKKGQTLGRSRGGLTRKIHLVCNSQGLPLKFTVTGGECSDFTEALPLLAAEKATYVLADRGYDSDEIVRQIEENLQAQAVIPPRNHRKIQRPYDRVIYRARNKIERLFNRLKQFRRIATRYDKLKSHFVSFISLACA